MKKNDQHMSEATYVSRLRCSSKHLKSGQIIESDAPTDNHGQGMKFSPTDLLSTSLAKCMLTVMGIKATEMNKVLDGSTAKVYKYMASNPRRVQKITVILDMKGDSFTQKEQKILEKIAYTCPVANSLSPELEQDIRISWEE